MAVARDASRQAAGAVSPALVAEAAGHRGGALAGRIDAKDATGSLVAARRPGALMATGAAVARVPVDVFARPVAAGLVRVATATTAPTAIVPTGLAGAVRGRGTARSGTRSSSRGSSRRPPHPCHRLARYSPVGRCRSGHHPVGQVVDEQTGGPGHCRWGRRLAGRTAPAGPAAAAVRTTLPIGTVGSAAQPGLAVGRVALIGRGLATGPAAAASGAGRAVHAPTRRDRVGAELVEAIAPTAVAAQVAGAASGGAGTGSGRTTRAQGVAVPEVGRHRRGRDLDGLPLMAERDLGRSLPLELVVPVVARFLPLPRFLPARLRFLLASVSAARAAPVRPTTAVASTPRNASNRLSRVWVSRFTRASKAAPSMARVPFFPLPLGRPAEPCPLLACQGTRVKDA